MKKIILGFVVLSSAVQIVFAQMGATPALKNNWSYTTPTEAFQMGQQSMAPIQNAVNTYGQRQFDMTMQLEQQAFAAQQQQHQLDAEAAAQAATGYSATTIANAFSQFYQDRAGAGITNALPYSGDTKIFTSLNTTNDIKELNRDGYGLIGVSAFQGPQQSQDAVMVQANKVGADAVLLSSAYLGTQQAIVDRYQYTAGFFRKLKAPILGIIGIPLPLEIRQQLERNTGVFVWVVRNDSPAFNANILESDVILKMNGEDVMSVADLIKKNATLAGQKIDMEIWRNGQLKTISVQLNNQAGVPPVQLPSDSNTPVAAATSKSADNDFEIIKAQAENGDAEAQDKLGLCYVSGKGVAKDEVEAAKWFRKAADQGSAAAQLCEGFYYLGGSTTDATPDYIEAAKWLRKAADQNNAIAELCLGDCYYSGQGVPKDYAEAVKWYHKAADQGNPGGQGDLGYCYANGSGVATNLVEAVKWYNLASAQGIEPAKKILSVLEQKMTPEQIAQAQQLSNEFQPHTESASTNSN